MSKYVNAGDVNHLIIETGNRHSRNGGDIQTCSSVCADLIIGVCQLPAADVVYVKHGRWVDIPFTARWICSNCDYISEFASFKYCPDCGARMDEVE